MFNFQMCISVAKPTYQTEKKCCRKSRFIVESMEQKTTNIRALQKDGSN